MMHFIKIHAKPILKGIAQATNALALIVGGLQASGTISMLAPTLALKITLGILALNYVAHMLKPYIPADTPLGTVALPTAVVPAPGAIAAVLATLPNPTAPQA